jgi:SAM-dependent methyltransferase
VRNPLSALVHRVGGAYVSYITRDAAARQKAGPLNERPLEYAFVFRHIGALQPRTVLDVGSGQSALPALMRTCRAAVTAIDNIRDYWPRGMVNRHWHVVDDDITRPRLSQTFDLVTCVSVLEHIADQVAAVRGLYALTRPGGHAIVTTPFGQVGHPNVYTLAGSRGTANPYICRQHSPADLAEWEKIGFTVADREYWRVFDSPYWSVGAVLPQPVRSDEPAHVACLLLQRPHDNRA